VGPCTVAIHRKAQRELEGLPEHARIRFYRAFEELAENPFRRRPGLDVRRLRGERGGFAIRVGAYRALFDVAGFTVRISAIAHRSVAYR